MARDAKKTNSPKFPRRCASCGKRGLSPATIKHTSHIKYEGKLHAVELDGLSVLKCQFCNEVLFGNEADEQIAVALRSKLGLLPPRYIRERREALGLTQRALAEQIGAAEETISRWENGLLIQSRAMDTLLRLYFDLPQVREHLMEPKATAGQVFVGKDNAAHEGCGYVVMYPANRDHSSAHLQFACDTSKFDLRALERPEVRGIVECVFTLTCCYKTQPAVINSFGTIIRSYDKMIRGVADELKQLRFENFNSKQTGGTAYLKRLTRFAELLVEIPVCERDLLLKSMLPWAMYVRHGATDAAQVLEQGQAIQSECLAP
jgi:putative zinc finger/helix-turn-helix YgiT family protein